LNADSYAGPANIWIKLHIGDPGAAGASNAATNTDRQEAVFGAASSGAITTTGAITWTSVPASEDYTHFSAWSASSAGTFLFSGTITANAVTASDTFVIPAGDLDCALTNVAA
jgi:uncharacterized membrane protein YgdD (TMEM256/DUF423 family)